MSNYICRYPDGAIGVALLLLRASYALMAFGIVALWPAGPFGTTPLYLAAGAIALFLSVGFATRMAALVLGLAVVVAVAVAGPIQQLLLAGHIGGCAAIVIIGPGAFSIDARRHGRRVIHLQAHTPDRGADD